jgi:hypothetical protein
VRVQLDNERISEGHTATSPEGRFALILFAVRFLACFPIRWRLRAYNTSPILAEIHFVGARYDLGFPTRPSRIAIRWPRLTEVLYRSWYKSRT